VIDVKEPLKAKIHKIIEPEEVFAKTGYSRPHTIHCGPEGIYVSTLGGGGEDGTDGPPGIFIMDCETFDILGRYEMDRGEQDKHYDFWWNLPRDYMVSSEWGLPPQFENGIVPRTCCQQVRPQDPLLEPARAPQRPDDRPGREPPDGAGDPARPRPGQGLRVLRRGGGHHQLQGAIFTWWQKDDGTFEAKKTITIDPRPEKARTCRRFCRASRPCRRW
jgi:selenium-binding protein 1